MWVVINTHLTITNLSCASDVLVCRWGGARHGVYHSHVRSHSGICVDKSYSRHWEWWGWVVIANLLGTHSQWCVCALCISIMYYEGAGYVCVYTLCLWGWGGACVCIVYVCIQCLCVYVQCVALVGCTVGQCAILYCTLWYTILQYTLVCYAILCYAMLYRCKLNCNCAIVCYPILSF